MQKRCLIIDNEEQLSSIEEIERLGRKKGLTIICDEFNVGSLEKDEFFTDNKIDISKVCNEFINKNSRVIYNIAAFDWDLGDDVINGVELIRKFQEKKILIHTPKILYSGLLKDKISEQLDKFKNEKISKDSLTNWINTLVRVGAKNYVDRTKYEEEIVTQLSKTDETLDLIIEEELRKFPDLRFKNSFSAKSFNGKTFLEIAKAIEEDDFLRNDFKKEIIQQTISYLTEMV